VIELALMRLTTGCQRRWEKRTSKATVFASHQRRASDTSGNSRDRNSGIDSQSHGGARLASISHADGRGSRIWAGEHFSLFSKSADWEAGATQTLYV
jgi:hypothetical protein